MCFPSFFYEKVYVNFTLNNRNFTKKRKKNSPVCAKNRGNKGKRKGNKREKIFNDHLTKIPSNINDESI